MKALLIVQTHYVNENRPGAWYLKGYNGKFYYDEIKAKIEKNLEDGKHKTRISYLVKYYIIWFKKKEI